MPSIMAPDSARAETSWIGNLLTAMLCAACILVAYEWTLRASGAEPNFRDNQARWSSVREAAGEDRAHDSIALLGTSRVRAAISQTELEKRYPDQAVYPLGYIGRGPCAVLEDLANETGFRGTVVISLNAAWVDCRPGPYQMHGTVARYHGEWNWARKVDAWAANVVTQNLVFTDPNHSIRNLIVNALEPGTSLLKEDYEITRRNRQLEFDFSRFSDADLAHMASHGRRAYIQRVETAEHKRQEHWTAGLAAFSDAIKTITARGGQVVLVRLPTSGPVKRVEDEYYPRQQYWDNMALMLSTTTALHYQDDAVLARFDTPDGNHLDHRDAARFTAALFDAIERDGVEFTRP